MKLLADAKTRTFLGQCPSIILYVLLSWWLIPNRGGPGFDDKLMKKLSRVDFFGAFLLGLTILAFLLPLELAGQIVAWTHPFIYGCFIAGIVFLCLYVAVEQRWAKDPIMSPALLMSRDIIIPNATQFCQTAAQLGVKLLPCYFVLLETWS